MLNNYLRELNSLENNRRQWTEPREEGDILITPDQLRWRIERTPTVGDLIKPGDLVRTNYDSKRDKGSIVLEVHKYTVCCCPHRTVSGTILCHEAWDEPVQTLAYHRELTEWGLIVVRPGAAQNKDGSFHERDYGYINELVAVGDRILHLFEANDDEVFVLKNKHVRIKPMQLAMF